MKKKSKAIFLDRDGVIIKDVGYLNQLKQIKFLPQTTTALRYAFKKDYKIIIITNQSVVGRGIISINKLSKIHNFIKNVLRSKKILIKDIFFCPHHPIFGIGRYKKKCKCRKPENLLIEKAIKKYNIDRQSSLFIGDKETDMKAAKKSNIKFKFRSKTNFYLQIKNLINK
tara:strand:+ start:894 stop:1403 length:510 start_codon:yes stop_codon:yes gene_type:complete